MIFARFKRKAMLKNGTTIEKTGTRADFRPPN